LLRLEELGDSAVSLQLKLGRALRGLESLARGELASDRRKPAWSGARRERDYKNLPIVMLFSVAIGVYLGHTVDIARLRSLSVHPLLWPIIVGALIVIIVVSSLRRSRRRKRQGVGC
jgi:hypothetical protein